ncbi:hypothetical protein BUMB_00158c [Candidatus Paraburkholderia calva]|nr:hypothetical protein BUMB_00158c [Candidatus Paraburkholderia calva]
MNKILSGIFACLCATANVHAQSNAQGPVATPAGALQFVRDDRDYVATLERQIFDRFDAKSLEHFDAPLDANGTLTLTLVQTESGPVLYYFRRNPPLVQRTGKGMTVRRVFWQGDEVVIQGSQGWYRFQRGTLTKLQASTTTYH